MRFPENNYERITALCVGATGVAFGVPLPGGGIEGSVAAAGLIGFVIGRKEKFGLECGRVQKKIRKEIIAAYSEMIRQEGNGPDAEAQLFAADRALHEALTGCMIDRGRLAQAALSPGGFPETAMTVVMDGLTARRPDLFGAEHENGLACRYARDVIRAGLLATVENEDYYRKLEPHLIFGIAHKLGEVHEDVRDTNDNVRAVKAMVEQVLANQHNTSAQPLLERLAAEYGHDNPNAAEAELLTFLSEKAKDYARLKAQISALTKSDARVGNLLAAAQAALDAGDFEEADARLADAEDMQQAEHTLKEVRKQAETRRLRGENMLMKGEVEKAVEHFEQAAAFFEPFDKIEGAELRQTSAIASGVYAEQYGGSGFQHAIRFYRLNLDVWDEADHPIRWAMTQNNLGTALRDQGARLAGAAGVELLGEAVAAYRAALRVYTEADHEIPWAATQINLGDALSIQDFLLDGAAGVELLGEAVAAYRAALRVYTENDHPLDFARTQYDLGDVLRDQGERLAGAARVELLGEAVAAFRAALRVRTEADHPLDWP